MNSEEFFANTETKKKAIGLIHKVYLAFLKTSRKYLASTKTKSEVRGGGKKPWQQKGSGRARAGSIRSPLWVGGGISFGPKPRTVIKKINKKERRLAILSALYLKIKRIIPINDTFFDEFKTVKTKNVITLLQNLELKSKDKILIVLPKVQNKFWLATRNIKNIDSTAANCINLVQILKADYILASTASLKIINLTYGK